MTMQRKRGSKLPREMTGTIDNAGIEGIEQVQAAKTAGHRQYTEAQLAVHKVWREKTKAAREFQGRTNHTRMRLPNGLTLGQESLCQNLVAGMAHGEAYRDAYNAKHLKPQAVYNRLYHVMQHPMVKARLEELWQEREAKASHTPAQIRLLVVERLLIEAQDKHNTGSTRVRAAQLLGMVRNVRLFEEVDESVGTHAVKKDELTQRLMRMLESAAKQATGQQPADY